MTPVDPDQREVVIEAAVRPFSGDAEMKLAAEQYFREHLSEDATDLTGVITKWNVDDAKKKRKITSLFFSLLMILISVAVLVSDNHQVIIYLKYIRSLASPFSWEPAEGAFDRFTENLEGHQKLLLKSGPVGSTDVARKRSLWLSEPENPAYFSEYAQETVTENNTLPSDYRGISRQLDPDNSWFTYLAAACEAKGAVDQSGPPVTGGDTNSSTQPTWRILDQGKMDRSMELLREAQRQNHFEPYSAQMLATRLALKKSEDVTDYLDMVTVLAENQNSPVVRTFQILEILSAQAFDSTKSADLAKFQEVSEIANHYIHALCDSRVATAFDELLIFGNAKILSKNMAAAEKELIPTTELRIWGSRHKRLDTMQQKRRTSRFSVGGVQADPHEKSSILLPSTLGMWAGMAAGAHPLSDHDLKPSRLIDHEVISRILCRAILACLLVFLLLTACHRYRVSKLTRLIAVRFTQLLNRWDWLWIIGVGIGLPFVFTMIINRWTPLGGRDSGLQGTAFLMPLGHFVGLLVLWLLLPLQLIRWRFFKRARAIGFPRAPVSGWVALLFAIAFIPMIGWAATSHSYGNIWKDWLGELNIYQADSAPSPLVFWLGLGSLSVPLIWLSAVLAVAIFGKASRQVFHASSAMALSRAFICMMPLLVLSILTFKASENYWFDRDTLLFPDESTPGWSAYEYHVAVQARKHLREILEMDNLQSDGTPSFDPQK